MTLLREFFVTFQGDEISWGLVLASWLAWTGLGALVAGRAGPVSRVPSPVSLLTTWSILPLLIATSLIATRTLRSMIGVIRGEMLGPGQMALAALLLLSLPCLALGALFTLTARAWKKEGNAASRVYFVESCGCLLGGIFAYFISYRLSLPVLISLLSLSCLAPLVPMLRRFGDRHSLFPVYRLPSAAISDITSRMIAAARRLGGRTVYLIIPVLCAAISYMLSPQIHAWSVRMQWPHETIIAYRNTPYGNITVGKEEEQLNFFLCGRLGFSVPDELTNQELFHLPLLFHPQPKQVLIISGALGGGLNEVLKHDPRRTDYTELDGELFAVAEAVLSAGQRAALLDPRIKKHTADGRAFLRNAPNTCNALQEQLVSLRDTQNPASIFNIGQSPEGAIPNTVELYDVILLNVPSPLNAAANRYYTEEFFALARKRLREDGILSIRIPFSEGYLGPEMRLLCSSILRALEENFPCTLLIPREGGIVLASAQSLDPKVNLLISRLRQRRISVPSLGRRRLDYLLDADRRMQAEAMLANARTVNRDLKPVSYLYSLALQSSQYGRKIGDFYLALDKRYRHILFLLPLLLLAPLAPRMPLRRPTSPSSLSAKERRRNLRRAKRPFIYTTLAVAGYSGMSLEVVCLLSMQGLIGTAYGKLALLVSFFMLGMSIGSGVFRRRKFPARQDLTRLLAALSFLCLLLPLALNIGCNWPTLALEFFYYIYIASVGYTVGALFPVCCALMPKRDQQQASGPAYAADIGGASLGALLTGALAVPILGVTAACLSVASLTLVLFIATYSSRKTL